MAEKGGYKHFMLKEIHEQPWAVRETLRGRASVETGTGVPARRSRSPSRRCATIERVVIVACGTSWHAGAGRQVPDRRLARVPVEVDYGSEFRYRDPIVDDEHAGDRDHAVGRDGGHAGGAARSEDDRARAASRSATSSAAWRRARPTARSTRTPGRRSASRRPRRSRRSSWRCTCWRIYLGQIARHAGAGRGAAASSTALTQLPLLLEQTLKCEPSDRGDCQALLPAQRLPLPRPRHQLPDRARRRAQAEGDLVHPRRGLPGRAR